MTARTRPCLGCHTPVVSPKRYRQHREAWRARGVRVAPAYQLCAACHWEAWRAGTLPDPAPAAVMSTARIGGRAYDVLAAADRGRVIARLHLQPD